MSFCYTPIAIFSWVLNFNSNPECLSIYYDVVTISDTNLITYLKFFFLTCLFELPFYFLALKNANPRKIFSAVLLCNLATHPIIYFLFPAAAAQVNLNYGSTLAISELFAPTVEAILLFWIWKIPARRAICFAISANIFSWWMGILILF